MLKADAAAAAKKAAAEATAVDQANYEVAAAKLAEAAAELAKTVAEPLLLKR